MRREMWLRRSTFHPYLDVLRSSPKCPWILSSLFAYSETPHRKPKLAPLQERKMVDSFRLCAKGGDGGNGCLSFHRSRHDRRGKLDVFKYSRLKTTATEISEVPESTYAETTGERMSDYSTTSRKFSRSRKKKLTAEDVLKFEEQKDQPSSPSRFSRTESIHHLHPSHHSLPDEVREASLPPNNTWSLFLPRPLGEPAASYRRCEVCDTIMSVKILRLNYLNELGKQLLDNALIQNNLEKATEALLKLQSKEAEELLKDPALQQSKEYLDTVETVNANKELLIRLLQDPNYVLLHHFQTLQASNAKRGLTKSESFPAVDTSARKAKHSKLKPMPKDALFFDESSVSLIKPGQGVDTSQTSAGFTLVPLVELKKQGENRLVINRFKSIRQKIKQAIKESRKEGRRISMDAIFHKIPYGRKVSREPKRDIVDKWREVVLDAVAERKGSTSSCGSEVSSPEKGGIIQLRRAHSLSESLDRYAHLFECSFSKEAKQSAPDRLKLPHEDGGSLPGSAPKSLARIFSLPDLGSYYSVRTDVSADALGSEPPTRAAVDNNASLESSTPDEQKMADLPHKQLDAPAKSGSQENSQELSENGPSDKDQIGLKLDCNAEEISPSAEMVNDLHDPTISISQPGQETGSTNNANSKMPYPSPISVLESCFREDTSSPARSSITEGSEFKSVSLLFDEMGSMGIVQDQNLGKIKTRQDFDSAYRHFRVNKKDEADFNYVKDVLTLSGFTVNEYIGTWHSPAHLVDPSLFEEVEASSPLKSNSSADEPVSNYDHQLLFDIINEVLLDIYERSFFYYPRPLSCNCHIRPMPKGFHVLKEVWSTISWYLSSQPELRTSLDYAVSRDLSRGDGWMNLQFESECVGLELEDMILDDLLDEVIYSSDY